MLRLANQQSSSWSSSAGGLSDAKEPDDKLLIGVESSDWLAADHVGQDTGQDDPGGVEPLSQWDVSLPGPGVSPPWAGDRPGGHLLWPQVRGPQDGQQQGLHLTGEL